MIVRESSVFTRSTVVVALAAALASSVTLPARTLAGENGGASIETQIVDALNKRYGVYAGYRANHAKGIVTQGTFKAAPEAGALSRSPLFTGATIPVTVRFSDGGGQPDVSDASPAANPHGIAIKFHLPNGGESDMVLNSFKFFPVGTAEDFRDLQLAAAASPPGSPKPTKLEAIVSRHPSVARANATLGIPDSFADEEYYGIDAFVFIDRAGQRQPVRYIVSPEHVVHLSNVEASGKSPNYLFADLPMRLKKGPVTFRVKAQLAAAGDQTKDATQPWPDDRKVVDLGVLTIDNVVADSARAQRQLLFLPGNLTEGIEPSDDPLIAARDGAYPISFGRRSEDP
jgi:catalase